LIYIAIVALKTNKKDVFLERKKVSRWAVNIGRFSIVRCDDFPYSLPSLVSVLNSIVAIVGYLLFHCWNMESEFQRVFLRRKYSTGAGMGIRTWCASIAKFGDLGHTGTNKPAVSSYFRVLVSMYDRYQL
jgi:hypothetical protein